MALVGLKIPNLYYSHSAHPLNVSLPEISVQHIDFELFCSVFIQAGPMGTRGSRVWTSSVNTNTYCVIVPNL